MSSPELLHRPPAEKQDNRRLVTVEVPPPQEPERSERESEGSSEALTQTYIEEATAAILHRMHPGEFSAWILQRSEEVEDRKAFLEALKAPEVFKAVKDTVILRLRTAIETNAKGGLLFWLLDFANGNYPRIQDLVQDEEVSPLLEQFYLMESRGSGKDQESTERLSQFKELFSISASEQEARTQTPAKDVSPTNPPQPIVNAPPLSPPAPKAPSVIDKVRGFLGF